MKDIATIIGAIQDQTAGQPSLVVERMSSLPSYKSTEMLNVQVYQPKTPHRYQQSPVFKRKSANKHATRYLHSQSHPVRCEHFHSRRTYAPPVETPTEKVSESPDDKVHLLSNLPWKKDKKIEEEALHAAHKDFAFEVSEHYLQRFNGRITIIQDETLITHRLPLSPRRQNPLSPKRESTNHKASNHKLNQSDESAKDHCESVFQFEQHNEANVDTPFSPIDTPTTPKVDGFFYSEPGYPPMGSSISLPNSPSTDTLKNYNENYFTSDDLGRLSRRSSDSSISSVDTVTL